MRVLLTKLSDERHRLDVVRDDGTREGKEFETRSFLVHDLAHFAVEAEAHLDDGFWGHVAKGVTFDDLANGVVNAPGLMRAEGLAAPFQSLWNGRLERAIYVVNARVSETFVDGALERMRKLMGQWKATPFRSVMELAWPP